MSSESSSSSELKANQMFLSNPADYSSALQQCIRKSAACVSVEVGFGRTSFSKPRRL